MAKRQHGRKSVDPISCLDQDEEDVLAVQRTFQDLEPENDEQGDLEDSDCRVLR